MDWYVYDAIWPLIGCESLSVMINPGKATYIKDSWNPNGLCGFYPLEKSEF